MTPDIKEVSEESVQMPETSDTVPPSGISSQERGRRGARARWNKAHIGTKDAVPANVLVTGDETTASRSEAVEKEEHKPLSPSERGKKGISHGMSAHDRGVKGAEARWGKVKLSAPPCD